MGSSRLPNINNLVPFDLDDEQQRQFEVNERRKRQNRIAQQNFRRFPHGIEINLVHSDHLKGKRDPESSRSKVVQPLQDIHNCIMNDPPRPQRLNKIIWRKKRQI